MSPEKYFHSLGDCVVLGCRCAVKRIFQEAGLQQAFEVKRSSYRNALRHLTQLHRLGKKTVIFGMALPGPCSKRREPSEDPAPSWIAVRVIASTSLPRMKVRYALPNRTDAAMRSTQQGSSRSMIWSPGPSQATCIVLSKRSSFDRISVECSFGADERSSPYLHVRSQIPGRIEGFSAKSKVDRLPRRNGLAHREVPVIECPRRARHHRSGAHDRTHWG